MSTLIKRLFSLSLLVALLASCVTVKASTPVPAPTLGKNPYSPQPGDDGLVRDTVQLVKAETKNVGGSPAQIDLNLSYFLPTPCHQFRIIVDQPGTNGKVNLDMYSLMKKDQPCALMALATPMQASFTLGNFPPGHYTIWINGTKAAEFDA
jgi:hypothetical protein